MNVAGGGAEPSQADVVGDVLDTSRPKRPWGWIVAAAVVAVALLGWNLRTPGQPDAAAQQQAAQADRGSIDTSREDMFFPAGPDRVEQLTFVDDNVGFLVLHACSVIVPGGPCPRRILATTDGGATWETRGVVPTAADQLSGLVVGSTQDLALVASWQGAATVARSRDGGRTWGVEALRLGGPEAAPPGAPVVVDVCPPTPCGGSLSWLDPDSALIHPLPVQPAAAEVSQLQSSPRSTDGDLVASAVGMTAGHVAMSRDGGVTWTDTRLEVPLEPGQSIRDTVALSAGGGRAYAFVQVYDSAGVDSSVGFRTDDGGLRWTDIGFQDQSVWLPTGILDGELISTDLSGRIYLSGDGGRTWGPGGEVPGPTYLTQSTPDGPVLATLVDRNGTESYYRSSDGLSWSPVFLPTS